MTGNMFTSGIFSEMGYSQSCFPKKQGMNGIFFRDIICNDIFGLFSQSKNPLAESGGEGVRKSKQWTFREKI